MKIQEKTLFEQLDNPMTPQVAVNKHGIIRERDTILNPSFDEKARKERARNGARRGSGIQRVKPIRTPQELMLGYEIIGQKIESFMYRNPKKKETKKEHTIEEFEKFLVQLMDMAWENQERGMRYLRKR